MSASQPHTSDALRNLAAGFPIMAPAAPFGVPPLRLITLAEVEEPARKCLGCTRKLPGGAQQYLCDVCNSLCCTACAETRPGLPVVCDNCLDD